MIILILYRELPMQSQFGLLAKKRFLPLFITQMFGAFNDNVFRNAMLILMTYQLASTPKYEQLLVTLALGVFILPFFLFSATGGLLADKFNKTYLIRFIKLIEIVCMILGSIGFFYKNLSILFVALFLIGAHSAFFGPIKYSVVPDLLKKNEILGGNALIEASTFLAILIGTMLGTSLIVTHKGVELITLLTLSAALIGWVSSFFIPGVPPAAKDLKIRINFLAETFSIIRQSYKNKEVFSAILGISWFWMVGAIILAQLPVYTKNELHADANVVTLFLATFSIGVGLGSLFCNRFLRGQITAKYVPLMIFLVSVFIIDLFFASRSYPVITSANTLTGLRDFIHHAHGWRVLFDMLMLSICSGLYVVPLYSIMQMGSLDSERSRMIASNNVINSLFVVCASALAAVMAMLNVTVPQVFLGIGIVNALVSYYLRYLFKKGIIK